MVDVKEWPVRRKDGINCLIRYLIYSLITSAGIRVPNEIRVMNMYRTACVAINLNAPGCSALILITPVPLPQSLPPLHRCEKTERWRNALRAFRRRTTPVVFVCRLVTSQGCGSEQISKHPPLVDSMNNKI